MPPVLGGGSKGTSCWPDDWVQEEEQYYYNTVCQRLTTEIAICAYLVELREERV